ncbi:hypothetical protein E2C01_024200 [Portunus trituberculatus]|uniref:Uncharacterized protein n=1 Tax=Portunus trituberculatus TaxID=210409 RepID=A0A5B7EBG1_PORTR|nr:hypothetical protein [Portunus trituberculatus]
MHASCTLFRTFTTSSSSEQQRGGARPDRLTTVQIYLDREIDYGAITAWARPDRGERGEP